MAPGEIALSDDQRAVYELVLRGESVMITGVAGTGKSLLLERLVRGLRARHGAAAVAVTAMTGIAATNIGGTTLHRWAGIGLGAESADELVAAIYKYQAFKRWRAARVLVIDEVSMMVPELFGKLEECGRRVRRARGAWGGLQLVLVGDFAQLGPVGGGPMLISHRGFYEAVPHIVELTTVHRQRDERFVALLREIRDGVCSAATESAMQARRTAYVAAAAGDIAPTRLLPTNRAVERINLGELARLPGDTITLHALDLCARESQHAGGGGGGGGAKKCSLCGSADKNTLVPRALALKVGAQVMLLRNLPDEPRLVNGSCGVVTRLAAATGPEFTGGAGAQWLRAQRAAAAGAAAGAAVLVPVVRFANGLELRVAPTMQTVGVDPADGDKTAERVQVPLTLAWALTIHKSQGQTLERAEVTLDASTFADGQAYVALSRVRSLRDLTVARFDRTAVRANELVGHWMEALRRGGREEAMRVGLAAAAPAPGAA
jgi:ATP-dependent DNA helicase PIF1